MFSALSARFVLKMCSIRFRDYNGALGVKHRQTFIHLLQFCLYLRLQIRRVLIRGVIDGAKHRALISLVARLSSLGKTDAASHHIDSAHDEQ